mgnify:FL=1
MSTENDDAEGPVTDAEKPADVEDFDDDADTRADRREKHAGRRKRRKRWTGPRRRWVPIAVLVVVAIGSAALTWLLTTIVEHKQEAKWPFAQVVQLTDTTYDPAVWGENFPIQYEQYKKTIEDTDGDFIKVDPTAEDPAEPDRKSVV